MKISVVIPTRNRAEHIQRALESLRQQIRQPDEIVIVDASDSLEYAAPLKKKFSSLSIDWFPAEPSVCAQRNVGIRNSGGDWIFLLDDDITLDVNYLSTLQQHVLAHPACGAAAGELLQMEKDQWVSHYPPTGMMDLLWRFVFQLSVWGDLSVLRSSAASSPLLNFLRKYYRRKGNGLSNGGWPLVTQWEKPFFETKIFSLGANLVRKEWLLQSMYDEVLDPGGIGDNYGVAMGFPGDYPIHVITTTRAFHHRAAENRVNRSIAYYRRVLALHYFTKLKGKAPAAASFWLLWSLTGNAIHQIIKRDGTLLRATIKSMSKILQGKNPYWLGHLKNKKSIQPLIADRDSES
jgi:glycosyltransferase involved in cell wall biosynthesis